MRAQNRPSDYRMQAGKEAEQELKQMLERWGFVVEMTGQESILSQLGLSTLRPMSALDHMVRAIRHKPDMLVVHQKNRFPIAYWDSKHKLTYNTDHFILGRDFYYEQLARMDKLERVVIAFKDPAGSWYAHWANEIQQVGVVPAPANRYGEGSDKVRFRVDSFMPIRDFLHWYWKK